MEPVVYLFDLDGVLVQPGGYREAVRATVNYFARQLGFSNLAPDDETIAIFEAQGVTCEWDMIPILLAVLLETAVSTVSETSHLPSLGAAAEWMRAHSVQLSEVNYAPVLRRLSPYLVVGEAPVESLLRLSRTDQGRALFPNLSGQGVLRELFAYSRKPALSRTTHIFQTYVLGNQVFTQSIGLSTEIETESYLACYDQPLLLPSTRDQLLRLQSQARLHMVAYTARPSLPLIESEEPLAVYTPEAEMALQLVGLDEIPLVGSGQMGEAAWHLGEPEDRLTKPAPYHALAAVVAALTKDRLASLNWVQQAFRFFEEGGPKPTQELGSGLLPDRLHLHIFEDSPTGLSGGREAARMLAELGVEVSLNLWGVSSHAEKVEALLSTGAQVYPDINQAIAAAQESQ